MIKNAANAEKVESADKPPLFDTQRWGLPAEAVADLASRLRRVWSRFRECFTTKTRDTSEYAFVYLRGLLTMDTKRNYANIARRVIDPEDDGQNLQHFMSDSPWPNCSGCVGVVVCSGNEAGLGWMVSTRPRVGAPTGSGGVASTVPCQHTRDAQGSLAFEAIDARTGNSSGCEASC